MHSTLGIPSTRGWPCTFFFTDGLPGYFSWHHEEFSPAAPLCDVAVVAVLVIATWPTFGKFRLQFGLMDLLAVTGCLAVAMSFHLCAWDHHFALEELAIDIGVFALSIQLVSGGRWLWRMLEG